MLKATKKLWLSWPEYDQPIPEDYVDEGWVTEEPINDNGTIEEGEVLQTPDGPKFSINFPSGPEFSVKEFVQFILDGTFVWEDD